MPSILSKLKRLNVAKTYVILDTQVMPYRSLLTILPSLVKGRVGLVQLRDKIGLAKDMVAFSLAAKKITGEKSLFIINDRVDVAMVVGADGVHVGQDDLPLKSVQGLVGRGMIIGVSCQNLAHARRAEQGGADYIGFGSVFKTQTKPNRLPMDLKVLQKVHNSIKIPIFPIGGINSTNMMLLKGCGIKRVAICRDVLLAKKPSQALDQIEQNLLQHMG